MNVRNALAGSSSRSSSSTTTIFGNSGVYAEVVGDEDTGAEFLTKPRNPVEQSALLSINRMQNVGMLADA
ncbi:MAG: hypothetical protein ABGW98_03565 [Myxococcales bacterium]